MHRLREAGFILLVVGAFILIIWGLYAVLSIFITGLDSIVAFFGRNFFANPQIPMPIRVSVPMVVLGLILLTITFLTRPSEEEEMIEGVKVKGRLRGGSGGRLE